VSPALAFAPTWTTTEPDWAVAGIIAVISPSLQLTMVATRLPIVTVLVS